MKQTNLTYREASPMIWGAWGAIIGGLIGAVSALYSALPEGQTVTAFIAGGFFWLWALANIKNWLGKHRP
jgi:hypothetical protein